VQLAKHRITRYGWVPGTPDQCGHLYAANFAHLKKLPPKVAPSSQCPNVIYHEGRLGSCTGNAIARATQFCRPNQKRKPDLIPSCLFIYCNERDIEGTIPPTAARRSPTASYPCLHRARNNSGPRGVSSRLRQYPATHRRPQLVGRSWGSVVNSRCRMRI
jgi:hypothetical protein